MSAITRKLLAAILTLILSVVMVVAMTYAWTTLSTAPVAEGIQITIGGGNTILIAPDYSTTVDGQTYHYPGPFSDKMFFSRFPEYNYLSELDSLLPVSTADGVNWFMPAYYDILDPEVINGDAKVGDIKPYSEFYCDSNLSYANLKDSEDLKGHYIYLDFWVVSPGSDYTLRVSQGDENGGSFVVELPEIKEENGDYALGKTTGKISSSTRLGFLANTVNVTDNAMLYYQNSPAFNDNYSRLRGTYSNAGDEYFPIDNRFLIYEPNGTLHVNEEDNGKYFLTRPIGYQDGVATAIDIRDRLSVQLANVWKSQGESITIDQIFKTAIAGKDVNSVDDAKSIFEKYLQHQYNPYVVKGDFVQKTKSLYGLAADDNCVDTDELEGLNLSGAGEDTCIVELEKNVPQKIRMFVWIEGQDIDYTSAFDNVDFAISIELAGSNVKANG
ncbi:MAG: hypothetical protein IKL40_03740 [Clostridia bacterium]|nr:hypothetical protein [Clostridia bacterium]